MAYSRLVNSIDRIWNFLTLSQLSAVQTQISSSSVFTNPHLSSPHFASIQFTIVPRIGPFWQSYLNLRPSPTPSLLQRSSFKLKIRQHYSHVAVIRTCQSLRFDEYQQFPGEVNQLSFNCTMSSLHQAA